MENRTIFKKIRTNSGSAVAFVILFTGLGLGIVNPGTLPIVADAETPTVSIEDRNEILWLARAVYSETKVAREQELIAWVVRNRMESVSYPNTYRKVVLERKQFSGLNPTDEQYSVNISMDYGVSGPGWDSALAISKKVYFAPDSARPFTGDVLHFYSPKSARKAPTWSEGLDPVRVVRNPEGEHYRFAFYNKVK